MLQPKLDIGCIIIEVYRSCTVRHTHLVGLLWTGDQPITEATYVHNTQQTQETNIHALIKFQTCDPSDQAAPNLCNRPHGHGIGIQYITWDLTKASYISQTEYLSATVPLSELSFFCRKHWQLIHLLHIQANVTIRQW